MKGVAPLNIDLIFATLLTSHEARFWLKDVTPLNMRRILVTPGNVQPDMSSLKSWYKLLGVHTVESNNCANEVKLGSKVQSLMGPYVARVSALLASPLVVSPQIYESMALLADVIIAQAVLQKCAGGEDVKSGLEPL